jgi:hypothetical protein
VAAGKDKLSERIAAATEEMAAGLTEASAAAEELRRSMEQIATGAEEAAGGSQEQLQAVPGERALRGAQGASCGAQSRVAVERRRSLPAPEAPLRRLVASPRLTSNFSGPLAPSGAKRYSLYMFEATAKAAPQ